MNPVVLAFVGDAVYTLCVRQRLALESGEKTGALNRRASEKVSAHGQSAALERILPRLTEEEDDIFRRGRTAKKPTKSKHASVGEYVRSTGFEALIGYLYLTGHHQGVIAITTAFSYSELEELYGGENSLIVLCDGIEDVHNLGSILRVAECAGADGVVIPNAKGASVTEAVIRISAGAAEHVRVAKVSSVNHAIEELQKAGYWVYALEAGGESIYSKKLTGKIGLVVGGEDSGVKRLTREKCDGVLSIPLFGKVNSLNASVALGIGVYEVVRARLEEQNG